MSDLQTRETMLIDLARNQASEDERARIRSLLLSEGKRIVYLKMYAMWGCTDIDSLQANCKAFSEETASALADMIGE